MGKEASVAPKERVNIVYRPATGNAQAEIELPLKLMMLGDWTGRADDRALEDRKPISIDKDNFNDVMKSQGLKTTIQVDDKLSGKEGDQMAVNLKFETLKDFEPGAVARQVPELNKLLELRSALTALKGPLGNVPAFKKKIEKIVNDTASRDALLKELGADKKEGE
ncbi:MAG: type VI secretion system contractile sheath small subunit [bacterium]